MNPLPPTPSALRAAKAACQHLGIVPASDTLWELALRIDRETHAKELRAALYESEVMLRACLPTVQKYGKPDILEAVIAQAQEALHFSA